MGVCRLILWNVNYVSLYLGFLVIDDLEASQLFWALCLTLHERILDKAIKEL